MIFVGKSPQCIICSMNDSQAGSLKLCEQLLRPLYSVAIQNARLSTPIDCSQQYSITWQKCDDIGGTSPLKYNDQ